MYFLSPNLANHPETLTFANNKSQTSNLKPINMLQLIADGGSTKTVWCLMEDGKEMARVKTQGLNPYFQTEEKIKQIIKMELLYQLRTQGYNPDDVKKIEYYGAGMRDEMKTKFQSVLKSLFEADEIVVDSDLLGAAKALCGNHEGIAAILGTGSNSCLYDGEKIVKNIPSLGFILGDEGSGAVLGRLFIGALFKGALPDDLREEYLSDTGQDLSDIIDKVYRQPMPNRYLAHAAKFIRQHIDCEPLEQLVIDNFRAFFRRNIIPYGRPDLPVNFVGSIAHHFEPQLRRAASLEGITIGKIIQSPLEA